MVELYQGMLYLFIILDVLKKHLLIIYLSPSPPLLLLPTLRVSSTLKISP